MTRWQRFKCWLGFHDWAKWDYGTATYHSTYHPPVEVDVQQRKCNVCGYTETEIV